MPTPGIALVGFMSRDQALHYLKNRCLCADSSDAALEMEWSAANAKRGAPLTNAGKPEILAMPTGHETHLHALSAALSVAPPPPQPLSFKLIEIDPLLAYQFHVDADRSEHHCAHVTAPSVADMLPVCLPLTPPADDYTILQQPQSVIVRSRSLNLQGQARGMLNQGLAGLFFGWSNPWVHVVRFNGRCYLHNGYHRTYGLRRAGATHVPCVFRDVPDAATAGIQTDGGTFGLDVLESADPPTLAHFSTAQEVSLRIVSRVMTVNWAEYVMTEE